MFINLWFKFLASEFVFSSSETGLENNLFEFFLYIEAYELRLYNIFTENVLIIKAGKIFLLYKFLEKFILIK
jgi:hypothetical protein